MGHGRGVSGGTPEWAGNRYSFRANYCVRVWKWRVHGERFLVANLVGNPGFSGDLRGWAGETGKE
jgi:hypothetical protein